MPQLSHSNSDARLVPIAGDMAERVYRILCRTSPGSQRLHGNEMMDLFETDMILQEASGDAARHVFVIEKGGEDVGFLDMIVRDEAAQIGVFSMPPNAPELRRQAWNLVEAQAKDFGAKSIRLTLRETESEEVVFFGGLGYAQTPASRAGWFAFSRSLL